VLDLLQWPAMLLTLVGTWLVASRSARRRAIGFWVGIASNAAWTVWGLHVSAYAVIALQFALAALNVRGIHKNDDS
jgi:hypothetical protein